MCRPMVGPGRWKEAVVEGKEHRLCGQKVLSCSYAFALTSCVTLSRLLDISGPPAWLSERVGPSDPGCLILPWHPVTQLPVPVLSPVTNAPTKPKTQLWSSSSSFPLRTYCHPPLAQHPGSVPEKQTLSSSCGNWQGTQPSLKESTWWENMNENCGKAQSSPELAAVFQVAWRDPCSWINAFIMNFNSEPKSSDRNCATLFADEGLWGSERSLGLVG